VFLFGCLVELFTAVSSFQLQMWFVLKLTVYISRLPKGGWCIVMFCGLLTADFRQELMDGWIKIFFFFLMYYENIPSFSDPPSFIKSIYRNKASKMNFLH